MTHVKAGKMAKGPFPFPKNMLTKIQVAQIRAFYAQNKSIRSIAHLVGVARNTVTKYIRGAEPVMPCKSR